MAFQELKSHPMAKIFQMLRGRQGWVERMPQERVASFWGPALGAQPGLKALSRLPRWALAQQMWLAAAHRPCATEVFGLRSMASRRQEAVKEGHSLCDTATWA